MIVMVGSLLLVGGCADDVVCPSAGAFALTAPDGFAQLGPTGTVTVAWTSDGDPVADLALRAIATDGVDFISIGGLTKHLRAIDLSMKLGPPPG